MTQPPGTRRPGGRTARTRAAVLQAALSELIENGYPGLTVERIAARAGVAKTTIYRRWGSLEGLLADLMAEQAAREIPVQDEGDLGSDLRALARDAVASVRDPAVRASCRKTLLPNRPGWTTTCLAWRLSSRATSRK